MQTAVSGTRISGLFELACTIPPLGSVTRPIAVRILMRKLTSELLQDETAAKIYDGLEHDDFMELLHAQAVHGHLRGFQANNRCFNVAAVKDTGGARVVSFDIEERQRAHDKKQIGDAWTWLVPKHNLEWCVLGTRLFHYA